jgi:hypothetical protein
MGIGTYERLFAGNDDGANTFNASAGCGALALAEPQPKIR